MKKIIYLALSTVLFAPCLSAQAQQSAKIPQVGLVVADREATSVRMFQQGLQELGYVEGKNIMFEYRYTHRNLDRIPSLVSELVQLKVDVLVLSNFRAIRAAKQTTQTIPVVMVTTQDPVETGIIDSLARPGGNITGLTRLTRDLSGKRLELLKEAVPKILRVGILWDARPDVEASGSAIALKEYEEAAHALKLKLQSIEVRGPNPDWEGAFQAAAKGGVGALITIHNALIVRYPKRIADLAIQTRLPSMYEGSSYVEAGGLMSYSSNDADQYKRAATYVDKILKGAKPADLPVEQPTKFEFVNGWQSSLSPSHPPSVVPWSRRNSRRKFSELDIYRGSTELVSQPVPRQFG